MSDMDAVRDSDNFEYVRLDASRRETRLVKLHPGRDSDPISCTVQHIRVGDTRGYETVSYCWGDGSQRSQCLLNGRPFSIPCSSATVLQQARSVWQARLLWIDALCINQSDRAERDEQVALMRDKYFLSSGNLIFLDVDSTQAANSLALFHQLWREAADFKDGFDNMHIIIGQTAPSKMTFDGADTAAFFAIVFSPWFR